MSNFIKIKIFDHKDESSPYRKIESLSIGEDERTIIIAIE